MMQTVGGGALPDDFSAVPLAMRERRQWLVWRFEEKAGAKKPAKMPYYVSGKRRVGVQGEEADRAALTGFEEAKAAIAAGRFTGLGFAFLPGDGLIGIDIDGAIDTDTGEIAERAANIIAACASYTEYSPSRKGVHIIVSGESTTFKSNDIGLEVFCGRQYFTVTGSPFPGTPPEVAPIDPKVLGRLKATVDAAKGRHGASSPSAVQASALPIDARAKMQSALAFVDPTCGYDDWLRIGMAIHAELGDDALSVWDAWSAGSAKYPGRTVLETHWKSFKPGGGVTGATVFKLAGDRGWRPPRPPKPRLVVDNAAESPVPSGESAPPRDEGKGGRPDDSAGEKREKKPIDWDRFNELRDNFVLIYGTDTLYDCRTRMIVKVNHARLAFGSDYVKMWLGSVKRRMILPEQLVFDPSEKCEPPCINLFDGFPMKPKRGDDGPIMDLLRHLCAEETTTEAGEEAVLNWVLRWLALPLQRPGTKMRSALVFHGPQGAGKNLFFEIVAALYGRYALVVGQDQLESDFNDWASQKLFLIGDEVVARAELFHQKNKLKAFITGETICINTKMLPLRNERNQVNVVFLSNEMVPLALEETDRRYFVVYTPPRRADDLYARTSACLAQGGREAFLHRLMTLDLGDATEFDIPPMTQAKRNLIDLGLKPAERFASEWTGGFLPLPLQVCSAEQLYRIFRRWCASTGERFAPQQKTFTEQVNKWARLRLVPMAGDVDEPILTYKPINVDRLTGQKTTRMWIPAGCGAPDGVTEGVWAGESEAEFEKCIATYIENTGGSGQS